MQKEQDKYRLLVQAQNNLLKIRLYNGNFNYYFSSTGSFYHAMTYLTQ